MIVTLGCVLLDPSVSASPLPSGVVILGTRLVLMLEMMFWVEWATGESGLDKTLIRAGDGDFCLVVSLPDRSRLWLTSLDRKFGAIFASFRLKCSAKATRTLRSQ